MRILVTGSKGRVGSWVASAATAAGQVVIEYDLGAGQDILDREALAAAMDGCDGVVHTAARLGGTGETGNQIMETNLQGMWNVLSTAREAGVRRVVSLSSVNALGVFRGEREPDYLPIDDAHPCYPATPYGISKLLGEEMCRLFAESSDVSVICLRPPGVWTEKSYGWILSQRSKRPEFEWEPFWEYGAFIDVRDLAQACLCGLTCSVERFACLLVSSPDVSTSGRTSRELAAFLMPRVPWRGGKGYEEGPFGSLVAIDNARRILGWTPVHSWQSHVSGAESAKPGSSERQST